jgi:hypothetical protein
MATNKRNTKNAPAPINYAAMMTELGKQYANTAATFAAVIPQRAEGANTDDLMDTASGEAAAIQSREDLVKVCGAIGNAEKLAGDAADVLRLRKFIVLAKAIVRNGKLVDMSDKGEREKFLAEAFPSASAASLKTYGSHLTSFITAEKAGVLGDIVNAMRHRAKANNARAFDAVKSALSAAKKAADGITGVSMKMPAPEKLDEIVAPKEKGANNSGSTAPKNDVDVAEAAAKLFRGHITDAASLDRLVTLVRAQMEKFLPKAQGPVVTDKNELAAK